MHSSFFKVPPIKFLKSNLRLFVALAAILFFLVPAAPWSIGAEPSPLLGNWVRPDGGYRLTVLEVEADGTVKAEYHNPNPINVAEARAGEEDGRITLFVKLEGVGYPGSTYSLVLEGDRLVGEYFQAAQEQTFNIFFEKMAAAD
jgi:hypothetical protein